MDGCQWHLQPEAFRGPCVVHFLRHLLRHIAGKLLVIWDGSPIHRAKVGPPGEAFLAEGGAQRLWLEQLPRYATELNPAEGIWQYLKRVRLGNVCCRTLTEVRYEVRLATAILRHTTTVLANLPKYYGCPL